jgi:signal transduction histidine kinase
MTGGNGNVSALWLAMLQRLADRTAHEIRNALNGVAVNLEVVRVRSARGTDLGSLTPYAASAAAELERVSAQTDALVSLARAAGSRLDLGVLLGRMHALLRSGSDGARLVVELQPGSAETDAGDAARVALAAALLTAIEREGPIACRVVTDRGATVYIECEAGGPLELADDVQAALEPAGVSARGTANGIAISFPSAPTG